jgi:hypothetical protein
MMKQKIFTAIIILSILFIIPGCKPGLPTCTVSQMQSPYLLYPAMWATVSSLQPTLSWTYPAGPYGEYPSPYYYGASACIPENYRIRLRTGPFFTDNLGGDTSEPVGSWVPSSPLQPGTEYAWAIQPMVGGVTGPSAGYRYFFTGPTCATAALVAPVLLEPANGAVITDIWPTLIWDYPDDCAPQGYRIDLSTHSDFSDTSLSGGTGNPSTRWAAGDPLENCKKYYWKVTAYNGTTAGPTSTTFSFRIDTSGTCPYLLTWPIFEIIKNAACRFGPGLDYNIMDYLVAGDNKPAEGRNEDGSWLLLRLDQNRRCWSALTVLEGNEDPMLLPLEQYPPIPLPGPTDTPVPDQPQRFCSRFTTYDTCTAQANYGCMWNRQYGRCDGP